MKSIFNNPFFRWIHTIVIMIWILLATTVLGSLVVVVSILTKKANTAHIIARIWGRSILWASAITVTVKGLEKLNPAQSYIYMANHQSNFDIPALLGKLPVQFRWLAKAELFRIPIFGHAMRGCEYISIDRSNHKMAFKSLTLAAKIIRAGTSVMIFPEGTRTSDGNLNDFKKGGFVLSVDAGVPIVPIIIYGTWSIMPKTRLRIDAAPVVIEICDPIETSTFTRKTKDDLIVKVRNAMIRQLELIKQGERSC
jgi:1-acyl-sn-glycerol-3-phosphate acyltransferase